MSPWRFILVLGVLYGILSLIVLPVLLIAALVGSKTGAAVPAVFGVGLAILMPALSAVLGFLGGVIAAALYNLIAKWTGGFKFEARDFSPSA